MSKFIPVAPSRYPKDSEIYLRWRANLKKRKNVWNKGLTKEQDDRVRQISETMKRKKIDNFSQWRRLQLVNGVSQTEIALDKSVEHAFLVGITLGDGNIHQFPRTEKFTLTLGSDKPKLIDYAANTIFSVFHKEPKIYKIPDVNAFRLTFYQKNISERLGIPCGARTLSKVGIPTWILESKDMYIRCLRGLYEAEASLCIHLPTCTYNFAFSNKNSTLLSQVYGLLIDLGLHPEARPNAIRLRRRDEVKYLQKLIDFREYP